MERNHQMTCPICMKSYADLRRLWQRLDNEIALTPMPQEYASWRVSIPESHCFVFNDGGCLSLVSVHQQMSSH